MVARTANVVLLDFAYQAQIWKVPRRVEAKVEWRQDELFPRVGFFVPFLVSRPPVSVN